LRRLLGTLSALEFDGPVPEIMVRVVDNDADRSAESTVREVQAGLAWPIEYLVEEHRGIPFARNTAVAGVSTTTNFVVFVDDDERVEPGWLAQLLAVQAQTGADLVAGPVVPEFSTEPPAWVRRGRFFERPRFPTGTELSSGRTSNLLVRRAVFDDLPEPFSARFAMTGGSDAHFAQVVLRRGRRIVWADEAVVTEEFFDSRVNVGWLVRRSYRTGVTMAMIRTELPGPILGTALNLAAAGRWVVQGTAWIALSPGAFHRTVAGLRWLAYSAGLCAGTVGLRYDEYRKIHGS
jgi:glycosyltransferase involved in cell wall biosynthesis